MEHPKGPLGERARSGDFEKSEEKKTGERDERTKTVWRRTGRRPKYIMDGTDAWRQKHEKTGFDTKKQI